MISQTAEYALRAVVCLARVPTDRLCASWEIAETTSVPDGYLSKVLQQLVRADVVRSQRGRSGGFRLARPPEEISILDVVEAVEPMQRIRRCPLDLPEHEHCLCALHRRVDAQMAEAERAFAVTTLAEVLVDPSPQWPAASPLEDPGGDAGPSSRP